MARAILILAVSLASLTVAAWQPDAIQPRTAAPVKVPFELVTRHIVIKGRVNNSRPEDAFVNTNSKSSPTPTPSISPSPSASPTPNPNTAQITRDVSDQIESWKENTENFDADGLMLGYAERVDYFRTENASKQQVWQDKQRALEKYDSIKFDISNMKINVDPSGETATAEFDKAWVFEGESSSRGKARSQLKFRKFSGRWLITSEKDLKVY